MAKRSNCEHGCDCIPVEHGYYWATHRKYGWREIVRIRENGFGHVRAWAAWHTSSFGLDEFKDYSGPIRERKSRG